MFGYVGLPDVIPSKFADDWTRLLMELERARALRRHLHTVAMVAENIANSGAPKWAIPFAQFRWRARKTYGLRMTGVTHGLGRRPIHTFALSTVVRGSASWMSKDAQPMTRFGVSSKMLCDSEHC